jgi:hypothetical protein
MGIDLRDMSLWQAHAHIVGYFRANGGKIDEALSDDEVDRLRKLLHAAA